MTTLEEIQREAERLEQALTHRDLDFRPLADLIARRLVRFATNGHGGWYVRLTKAGAERLASAQAVIAASYDTPRKP